jgi:hypothetical protein
VPTYARCGEKRGKTGTKRCGNQEHQVARHSANKVYLLLYTQYWELYSPSKYEAGGHSGMETKVNVVFDVIKTSRR